MKRVVSIRLRDDLSELVKDDFKNLSSGCNEIIETYFWVLPFAQENIHQKIAKEEISALYGEISGRSNLDSLRAILCSSNKLQDKIGELGAMEKYILIFALGRPTIDEVFSKLGYK